MNSDGVLVDIPDDDEFDECTGALQVAAEYASAIASSGVSFPDSTQTGLFCQAQDTGRRFPGTGKNRRLSIRPRRLALRKKLCKLSFEGSSSDGRNRLLCSESRSLTPLMMLSRKSLRRWAFQRICKNYTMRACHC